MKDLCILKDFLGIEVARSKENIFLSQRKHALDVLTEAGILGCQPIDMPMEQNHRFASADGSPYPHPDRYRRLVGRLVYLSVTRPELILSLDAALRVLRYLRGIPGRGIVLCPLGNMQLTAFCDNDWAACSLTRRSVTGYLVFLGRFLVSCWKTKKQPTVARSSAEAGYRAMAVTTCELK
ncbi:uncharacterized mitochondrial protein AtMg00810-like [Beta vulgaris subsp. vulgaris]|uniref:uncharacterized mitochondrial protein AtMg00810-like n=1 Tax=Beta vulgaris subsp. vulgaris TaxID=3555 RepID=UPI0020370B2D|nr:uncharacterized mitochondrial protein AtMg00810-like [Beta vulgaris subsp. vulgaris]